MIKENKQKETYGSPNLNVFHIKVQQCIATSPAGTLNDWTEDDSYSSGSWTIE